MQGQLSSRKRLAFSLCALGLGVVSALLIFEVVLRWHEARTRESNRDDRGSLDLLETNPEGTGSYRLKPNLDITVRVGRDDVVIQTNSHGMRWREVSMEGGEGRRRVAFFGDSFTFGCWSDSIENSLVGVFERNVSPDRWEVLNFGVGGYGFADIELLLREKGIRFNPSYVIIVMFNGNDFRDTYLGVDKENIVDGMAILNEDVLRSKVPDPFVEGDNVRSRPSAESSFIRRTLRHSAVWRLVAPFLYEENLSVDFAVSRSFTSFTFWSQHPYPDIANKAKDVTLEMIERINAFLIRRGVKLALVAVPMREQVHASRLSGPDYDIHLPQSYVRNFARDNNIPFLDLLPILRAHVQKTNRPVYMKGDIHLNNEGHDLAGWHISEWFRCCVKNQPIPGNSDQSADW
jgi:lysophospholipase L1-like esterase